MHYALIESNVVKHVLRVPPENIFPAQAAALYMACPEDVDVGGTFADGVFSPPPRLPPQVTADQLRTALTAEYERRMQAIAAGYPPSERESWPVQTSEATALIADPQEATPWIDSAAVARGVDRFGLALRIAAKDAQYRVFSGTLSGVRQRIEDQIDAAGDDAQALQAIDVTAGWPEA